MKKKKKTSPKAKKEVKQPLPCNPIPKVFTTGSFFDGYGKDPKHLEGAVVIKKEELNNEVISVFDISKYRGEGLFADEEKEAFVLLIEVAKTKVYGTTIISGEFLSPALNKIFEKRKDITFPFSCILKKKKAWGLYSPK